MQAVLKAPARLPMRPTGRRGLTALATALLLLVGGGALLHTNAARPLLVRLFGTRCPALAGATAASIDRARQMAVAASRGDVAAPARPALGFVLDGTTRDEALAWARDRRVDCRNEQPWLIQCSDVDPTALGHSAAEGRIEELSLAFRPDGRLSNVATLRRHLTPREGARIVERVGMRLYEELGRPLPEGPLGKGELSHRPLSSLRISFRYRDYFADVTAMNLPTTGVAVREQYLSATD